AALFSPPWPVPRDPNPLRSRIYVADKGAVRERFGAWEDGNLGRAFPRSASGGYLAGSVPGRPRRQAGKSGKSSYPTGGGRAGRGFGASVGRRRWLRILRMTSPASMVAITDMRPPHCGQAST